MMAYVEYKGTTYEVHSPEELHDLLIALREEKSHERPIVRTRLIDCLLGLLGFAFLVGLTFAGIYALFGGIAFVYTLLGGGGHGP